MQLSRFGMRIATTFFVATLALGIAAVGSVGAAAPTGSPDAVVKKFIDDFNKGDIEGAASTHAADASIIDEFPPHQWRGKTAFKDWLADLQADAKAKEQSEQSLKLGKTLRSDVNGKTAYVVMAGTFAFKEKGKAMSEPGQLAFALAKDGEAWKIASWAWAGSKPH